MKTITLRDTNHTWNPLKSTITMGERDVPFDTSYRVINPKSGGSMDFEFSHSTGPEFNPQTKWIYYNSDKTVVLEVGNDPEITKRALEAYLETKKKRGG